MKDHLLIVALRTTTGLQSLDDLFQGLISLFELSFPGRIQSYYLGGSYSDGTAVGDDRSPNASDIDLFVIFRESVDETEQSTFNVLVDACRLISRIHVDAHPYALEALVQQASSDTSQLGFLNGLIKASSQLLYGEDIRLVLPDVPFPRYVLDVIESGLFHVGILRQRGQLSYPWPELLVPPLAYPSASEEFYGYDAVPAPPGTPRGTRVLVGLTVWIATFILALETGHVAGRKSQSLQLCKTYLPNDQRIHLVAAIYDLCKGTWGYALPEQAADREHLRSLCREVLVLENEHLRFCRNYVLTQLRQDGILAQRQALRVLENAV